jgi:hypothetical protein
MDIIAITIAALFRFATTDVYVIAPVLAATQTLYGPGHPAVRLLETL